MKIRLKSPYRKEPKGGWHLIVDGICFRGIGPDEVIEKVRQYLLANGRPPRDIMGDLITYCQAKYPHLVEPDYDGRPEYATDPLERVMNQNLLLSRRPLMNEPEKKEIDDRIATCSKCPHHQKLTGPLEPEVTRTSYMLAKGNLCKLGYCDAHGWDNRVAVRWDEAILKPVGSGSVEGCWI